MCLRENAEINSVKFVFNSEPEAQIIAYKTQQYKLLPGLAMAYATKFTFDRVWRMFKETQTSIAAGDFTLLPEVRRYLVSSRLNRALR